jgi:chemotaxis protein CheD
LAAAVAPTRLVSYSLGSCVAVVLYHRRTHVGGMAHVMLPQSDSAPPDLPAKFGNQALEPLIASMEKLGADRRYLVAKVAGGASLFGSQNGGAPTMGERNVAAVKESLARARIRVLAEDTGGDFARTVTLSTKDGVLRVRTFKHGEYEI